MATVEIELKLVGSAKGVPVELAGSGEFDAVAGRLLLDLRLARPLLMFDPALIALGLLDVLAHAATQDSAVATDADSPAHIRSGTDLYDENGRDAGGWRVVATLARSGQAARLEGQLLGCSQRIEPGERVVAVDASWTVLVQPLEPEGVLMAGAWEARSGRGNCYRGVTTTLAEGGQWASSGVTVRIGVNDVWLSCTDASLGERSIGAKIVVWSLDQ
jgi:hypothetical protein